MVNEIEIEIDSKLIGLNHKPYIIAELSANHNGSLERALKTIEEAHRCGADAIKIQTYTADSMTIDCDRDDFMVKGGLWDGYKLYDLYNWAHTPYEWHKPMFNFARELGITMFSTPFDENAVDLLEDLNAPAYKIASFEAIDLPLIKYVALTKKPMIISTGMADLEEIEEAVSTAQEGGCKDLALLHCVSGYPAPASDYNLRTLVDMKNRFNLVIGLSDHTIDNNTAISSVALGGSIIEKHVTLDRQGGGPDDSFSLEKCELKQLCEGANTAWKALGKIDYGRKSSEQGNVKYRRSLYFIQDILQGEIITEKHIKSIRPGYGLAPKHYDEILGKNAMEDIKSGTAVTWEHIKK